MLRKYTVVSYIYAPACILRSHRVTYTSYVYVK